MELLTCQHNAYTHTVQTSIVAHRPSPSGDGVEVQLHQTILYPEGGGQPDDHGAVDGQPVRALRRDADGVLWHRLDALPRTAQVTVTVDWQRRFDHMQQHTAQHLLSALALAHFSAATTAFHLRPDVCDITLDRMLSSTEVAELERMANDAIRANVPTQSRVISPEEHTAVRSRGLPDGFKGPIRLVEIQGIDSNTCGGTHVASLGELQAISLLPIQKHKGGASLRYLAGGRVLHALQFAHAQQHTLSKLLSCGAEGHADAIARLKDQAKQQARTLRQAHEALAALQGTSLAQQPSPHLHQDDADVHFLRAAANAATQSRPDRVFLLTGAGIFLLAGPKDRVAALGPEVAACLESRGGGSQGRYQGRLGDVPDSAIAAALTLLD